MSEEVILFNLLTRETMTCKSYSEAARKLGCSFMHVKRMAKKNSLKLWDHWEVLDLSEGVKDHG